MLEIKIIIAIVCITIIIALLCVKVYQDLTYCRYPKSAYPEFKIKKYGSYYHLMFRDKGNYVWSYITESYINEPHEFLNEQEIKEYIENYIKTKHEQLKNDEYQGEYKVIYKIEK